MFCQPGTYDNCVGYDFKGFYPRILGSEEFKDFKIPTKRGTEKRYKRIPKNILPGIYRVKITSDHPHAPKLFTFSKNDGYTHYSLNHALSLVDKYDFNVEIICDGKPNAYVYAEEDMVVCNSIFGNWLNVLMDKKARFPKNKLVKHLLSSIWGHLSQANVINVSEEKSQDLDVGFLGDDDCDWFLINETHAHDGVYYTLQNAKQPYHHNIRLKPFITSFGRTQVARIIEPYVDHVIRVQTDGVCYNNFDPKFPDSYGIGIEADKSGRIKFVNVNKYEKL